MRKREARGERKRERERERGVREILEREGRQRDVCAGERGRKRERERLVSEREREM
jgi:hypothetical protein